MRITNITWMLIIIITIYNCDRLNILKIKLFLVIQFLRKISFFTNQERKKHIVAILIFHKPFRILHLAL